MAPNRYISAQHCIPTNTQSAWSLQHPLLHLLRRNYTLLQPGPPRAQNTTLCVRTPLRQKIPRRRHCTTPAQNTTNNPSPDRQTTTFLFFSTSNPHKIQRMAHSCAGLITLCFAKSNQSWFIHPLFKSDNIFDNL